MLVIDLSRRLWSRGCRRANAGCLEAAIAVENRVDVSARRSNIDTRDEFLLGERPRAGSYPVPLDRPAVARVVSREHARFTAGSVVVFIAKLFQIPATDLNVGFRIVQERSHVRTDAVFGLSRPRTGHGGRHLHESDLAVLAVQPWPEIGLFVGNAPNKIAVDAVSGGFPGNQRVITMDPVLIEKIQSEEQAKPQSYKREDDD